MTLALVGVNHKTAGIDWREKIAFHPAAVGAAAGQLRCLHGVSEAVIVSTCNRTELYLAQEGEASARAAEGKAGTPAPPDAASAALQWLADQRGVERDGLAARSYRHHGDDVARHLMRVACGLDSMVVGEPQIFGQIKSAYAVAKHSGAVGPHLERAFQAAFTIAKQVRCDTAIGENPVSVAFAAVTLAGRIFANLASLKVLLIGAGNTVELVARHLAGRGVRQWVVANRTLDNALELAGRLGGAGVLLADIPDHLAHADMVVSSTNSQLPLLGKGAVGAALGRRRHRPMLLIDLAVPRDIEPQVADLDDAYLYGIDDIATIIDDNVRSRSAAASAAEAIIDRGVHAYRTQARARGAVETVTALRRHAENIGERELSRARKALARGEEPEAVVQSLARAITRKLMHEPCVQLRAAGSAGQDDLLQAVRRLHGLDGGEGGDDQPSSPPPLRKG